MKKYYLILLLPLILSASRDIAKLQMACDIGNEKACIKLKEYKSKKKDSAYTNTNHIIPKHKTGSCVSRPQNLFAWRGYGISSSEATEWACAGIHRMDAKDWKRAGIQSAREAQSWIQLGVELSTYRKLMRIGIKSPKQVQKWIDAGATAPQINYWIENGVKNPEEVKNWINADISLSYVSEWKQSGITSYEASKWADIGVKDRYAIKDWKHLGVSPAEASKWKEIGLNRHGAKNWIKSGILTANEASEWISMGIKDYSKVATWKKSGFNTPYSVKKKLEEKIDTDKTSEKKLTKSRVEQDWTEFAARYTDYDKEEPSNTQYQEDELIQEKEFYGLESYISFQYAWKILLIVIALFGILFIGKRIRRSSQYENIKHALSSGTVSDIYSTLINGLVGILVFVVIMLNVYGFYILDSNEASQTLGVIFSVFFIFVLLGYLRRKYNAITTVGAKINPPLKYDIPKSMAEKIVDMFIKNIKAERIAIPIYFKPAISKETVILQLKIEKKGGWFKSKKTSIIYISIRLVGTKEHTDVYYSAYTMESKSDNHAIVLEGEAQEKIGRNIASFFDKVIDSIKESIRTRKSTKKKASDSDKNLAEIANLLKEPYTHIASLVKTDMALISPTYSIYQRLLEHGLRQNPPLSVSDLKEQMMQVSYADNIHTSISQKEKKTIEYIISFVKDSRAALSAFGVSMNPSLFVLGDQEIIFLQTKIATLKNTFTEELKKLENLQNVFMQYGNEIQESVLTQLVDVMQSQRCYKKINDICYLSALNIIFDLKADGEEAAQALVAFKDWARQYDKVYWECLPQYKKEIDILSNDVASVIVHHYKVAHGVFMTSKAKMDYINHIENILTEHYLDKKREIKVSRVNSYENALK